LMESEKVFRKEVVVGKPVCERHKIEISGIVQGVGFRPFVYRLAKSLFLNGWVCNISDGVVIEVEGDRESLEVFLTKLRSEAPTISFIKELKLSTDVLVGYDNFTIKQSSKSIKKNIYFSPDVSICKDCERELFDKDNRRYLYPFINCTNCGPRFTIIKGVPYDRKKTTMSKFCMCDCCTSEYSNPNDRRYHAQPISCYDCGPEMVLTDSNGEIISSTEKSGSKEVLSRARLLILDAKIVAIKGIGGYHLACDATNEDAVKKLRSRKIRDDKPFALMVKDYNTALKYCEISKEEKELLESVEKPIVLLKKNISNSDCKLNDIIAPGNPYLGIMLPYTPVQLLLFNDIDNKSNIEILVMTSANRSDEPIYYKDEDAFENLRDIADYFLTNDRDIFIRTDDSVTRVLNKKKFIIRRSRGYVPMPIDCTRSIFYKTAQHMPSVLACGAELKNTFCLNRENDFFISHHIGDLENTETYKSFEEGISHFKTMFDIKYDAVAYDLHPGYLSTKYALHSDAKNLIPIQHHHAHIASCAAENSLKGDIIGVAFDGTGYGEDGHIWGGEFFFGDYANYERAGHLEYVRMPGGEMAIKEPWRMALSYLTKLGREYCINKKNEFGITIDDMSFLDDVDSSRINAVRQVIEKNINSPFTSSMGRLFDAVAALTGIRSAITYEGQAAIEMEYIAQGDADGQYRFEIQTKDDGFIVCTDGVFEGIISDMKSGITKGQIAARFHETVAEMMLEGCRQVRDKTALNRVVLSGGVFQNITLLEKSMKKLTNDAFEVYIHSKVPTNDGGISFGQAVIAVHRLQP